MRISAISSVLIAALAWFATGCAGPEQKLGRGISNVTEFGRLGEMRRSVEQTAFWSGGGYPRYTTGVIKGFNYSVRRTAVGVYEMVTFPFPSYDPVSRYWAHPVYPDSYRPSLLSDPLFSPDTAIGFQGGDIAPFVPGSRFHVFDD